ncbi:uncharacterized protein LOC144159579 isoform X1 [Haemaphysalis longicornis]
MYFYHNAFAFFTGRILTPQVKKEPTTRTESTTCVPTTKQCRKSTTRVPSSLYRTSTTLMPAIGKSALHVPTNLPAKSSACVSKLEASEDRPSLSSSYSTVGTHADRAEEDSAASSDGDISVKNGFPGSHALAGTSTDTIYSSDEVTNITKSKNTDNVKSNATSCSANGNNSAVASCSANGDDSGVKASDGRQGVPCRIPVTGQSTVLPANIWQQQFTAAELVDLCAKSSSSVPTNLFTKSAANLSRPCKLTDNPGSSKSITIPVLPGSSKDMSIVHCSGDAGNTSVIMGSADTAVHFNDNANLAGSMHTGDNFKDSEDSIAAGHDFAGSDEGSKRGHFRCEHCPYVTKDNYHLERHTRAHTGEKPFKCDVCPRAFSMKYKLNQHKHRHTGERSFKCNLCPATFTYMQALTVHKATHTGQKPYRCKLCSVSFDSRVKLVEHNAGHSKEVSSKCSLCSRVFYRTCELVAHMVAHHKIH